MVKLYPFILQKLLAKTHSLMRAEDHWGNKKPSASHKFCKLLSKRKKNQIIKTQTLKTNGIRVTFAGSFLKQTLIFSLQAVNHANLPTYHCKLPKTQFLLVFLYYDIVDSR